MSFRTIIERLADPFPKETIHWRAQTMTNDGTKAMALAYIDARNVMERLDAVCGPENWQDEYLSANNRTICRIGIKINGEWIWKSDGAGDTHVEAEKGGISDAFKRAAVKWGVGRYLYALSAPWVPCSTYEKSGKKYFKAFTQDPWTVISKEPPPPLSQQCEDLLASLDEDHDFDQWATENKPSIESLSDHEKQTIRNKWQRRKSERKAA